MSTSGVDGHMRCRKLVCVVCYKKGNRDISANELLWIQDNLIDRYDANDANFPAAMCAYCHILLSQRINGIDMKQQLPKVMIQDKLHYYATQNVGAEYVQLPQVTSMFQSKKRGPQNKIRIRSHHPLHQQ